MERALLAAGARAGARSRHRNRPSPARHHRSAVPLRIRRRAVRVVTHRHRQARGRQLRDLAAQLVQPAQRRAREQAPVTVWVDPQRPHRAVLDRDIRWGMVIFHIPFALLFTAIGGAALYAFLYLLVTPTRVLEARKKPQVREAADNRVQGGALWLMAVFWCGLAWPCAALVWMEPQPLLPRIIVSFFAGVGAWLLWHAFRGGSLRTRTSD
ncbi:DUF3592 domain-containing protein [Ramlibacter terrae]|uniref:DUF3592 domain-containing protein n=1 Tax=Ramlibacter terrae TaxID=2732511 RepID=A0ABX6P0K1_9BURK|nr:DUF3592 domain-containing protein [Ramlibacter terrae]